MIRQSLAAFALATLVGCSASSSINPFASRGGGEQAQMAAYAATAHYPSDARPSSDIHAGAIVDARENSIKVANFSDQPMRDVNVWVNGSFVYHVSMIPAHGSVTVNPDQMFDASGENMAKVKATPSRVELQTGDRLYSLGTAM